MGSIRVRKGFYWSYIICHLSFVIFGTLLFDGDTANGRRITREKAVGLSKMTNVKCQMIYDQ
jgi:hypothetical protein